MAYGIKVSLPGFDVNTATPEQCAVNSEYPSPLIEENHLGTLTYLWDTDLGATELREIFSVSHGYSYTPKVMCMITNGTVFDGSEFSILAPFIPSSGQFSFEAVADSTNFTIRLRNYTGALLAADNLTYTFKYYILTDDTF